MNTISMDKEVYAGLRRGHPRHAPNLVTIEQVSTPPDRKAYGVSE